MGAFGTNGAGLEVMARVWGSQWLSDFAGEGEVVYLRRGRRLVRLKPCELIDIQPPKGEGLGRLWIDPELGIIIKYESDDESVSYHTIRANHHVRDEEFKIPDGAIRLFKERQKAIAK